MNVSDLMPGSTITDNNSEIGRIVYQGDKGFEIKRYYFVDGMLVGGCRDISLEDLSDFNCIEESVYLKAEDLFQRTMSQVLQIFNDAERYPVDYSDGKCICRTRTFDESNYYVLHTIHYESPIMAELETLIIEETTISYFIQHVKKEKIHQQDERNSMGIDAKVVEKIRKILNLSISAFQSMVRDN